MIGTEGARLLWEMRDRWDAAEGPQYLGHACVTTGRRGLICHLFMIVLISNTNSLLYIQWVFLCNFSYERRIFYYIYEINKL